ncbi:MAG: YbjN domain-containing protein [Planctomycetota bacterium]
MGRIYESMVEWFQEDGWNFQEHPERGYVSMGVDGSHANWRCFAQADEEREIFVFYAVAPVKVPEEQRHDVALFTTRANYGMRIGNFELDLDDGELRYKTSVDVEGTYDITAVIRQCVAAALSTADRYFPGLAGILYAGLSPQEAVAKVEGTRPAEE